MFMFLQYSPSLLSGGDLDLGEIRFEEQGDSHERVDHCGIA